MKILVVDDQADNRCLLEALFKGSGHTVVQAVNGDEGLALLQEQAVDLVISDILMPVMDGFEFCRRLKADERLKPVPFIFYTATYTGPQDEDLALKLGAARFIVKPCEPREFLKAVEEVMAAASPGQAAAQPGPPHEQEVLKLYNERLVRKLEQKMLELEREVAERRASEAQRSAFELRYRLLFENALDGIMLVDAQSAAIIDVNPALGSLLGYAREQLIGFEIWKFMPFGEIRANQAAFASLKREGCVHYDDLRLQTRAGGFIDVQVFGNLYKVGGSSLIQYNLRDISMRKAAEQALAASENRYMGLFNTMRDAYVMVDMDGHIQDFNPAMLKMLGYSADELRKLSYQDITPERWHGMEELIVRDQIMPQGYSDIYEKEYRRRDGTIFPIELQTVLMRDDGGRAIGMWALVRDISERKQLEAQRLGLEEQLRLSQKMEAIGSLAGGLAHDFNNLLSVILGHIDFALLGLEDLQGRNSVVNNLKQIQKAGERAATLTRQLLAFSRKQDIRPIPLNLNQVVVGIESMFRRLLGEEIVLRLKLESGLGLCFADPVCMEQVLMNLVVNARDAMPEGGQIMIETANRELDAAYAANHIGVSAGPYIMLAVTDTGIGMDAQTLPQIFDPFFTTKEAGKGTGLGLAMVYGIVRQSEGTIWVYSEPGHGTTFKVLLPRLMDAEDVLPEVQKEPVQYAGSETVLIVEDEAAVLDIAANILKSSGYTVLAAASGAEALAISAAYAGPIDLLLTDIIMPNMHGTTLAAALRQERPAIKVLYMSGYTSSTLMQKGILAAGDRFIEKPFNLSRLKRMLRETLDGVCLD
ncbi:MAG: Blue-light-activated protein [Deltaproteobacteria bacterium ADurb.Bin510]|nr:MAG: Blue-light-activated protein [Deltaproteobacteria bacterium ADurb.Bin510]